MQAKRPVCIGPSCFADLRELIRPKPCAQRNQGPSIDKGGRIWEYDSPSACLAFQRGTRHAAAKVFKADATIGALANPDQCHTVVRPDTLEV